MTTTRTYKRFFIDPIYDDESYTTVIGYDVREPGTTVDDMPVAEMLRTVNECKSFINDSIAFHTAVKRWSR